MTERDIERLEVAFESLRARVDRLTWAMIALATAIGGSTLAKSLGILTIGAGV